ncbi:hypothetical protein AVEN_191122-1 [Araneus ventricosus]|uniref:Uncharacterized protein n=1 Tax=Araneus ventricosus TaxID=182803 RepID=A0A4Y2B054_ARAVE|nr:hypothetical protein AVEN_191122-1 [Araneus ventricosus]
MAGETLEQASVIRFRSSCNVGGGVAYTRCLMYPHRKKSNGFRSGKEKEGFTPTAISQCARDHWIISVTGNDDILKVDRNWWTRKGPLDYMCHWKQRHFVVSMKTVAEDNRHFVGVSKCANSHPLLRSNEGIRSLEATTALQ